MYSYRHHVQIISIINYIREFFSYYSGGGPSAHDSSAQYGSKRHSIDIVRPQATQTPVLLGRLGEAVVVKLGRVGRAHEAVRDGAAEEEREHTIFGQVVFALVPCEDDESLVDIEVVILE